MNLLINFDIFLLQQPFAVDTRDSHSCMIPTQIVYLHERLSFDHARAPVITPMERLSLGAHRNLIKIVRSVEANDESVNNKHKERWIGEVCIGLEEVHRTISDIGQHQKWDLALLPQFLVVNQ